MKKTLIPAFLVSIFYCSAAMQAQADIIGYWRRDLDTQNEFAVDSSGNALTLSSFTPPPASISSVIPTNTIPLTGSTNASSFGFDGAQRMVTADSSTGGLLDFNTSDAFTIEGWFNSSQLTSQTQVLIEKRQSGGQFNFGYAFLLRSNGRLTFFGQNDQGGFFDLESTTIIQDTWYHFAGVYANGTAGLYIDGNLVSNVSGLFGSGGTFDNTGGFSLGQTDIAGANLARFNGYLDEIKITNEGLSPNQFLNANSIPEPTCFGFLGLSLTLLVLRRHRR